TTDSELLFRETAHFYYSTYSLLLLNAVVNDRGIGATTALSVISEGLHQLTMSLSNYLIQIPGFVATLQKVGPHKLPRNECSQVPIYHIHHPRFYFGSKIIFRIMKNGDSEGPDIQSRHTDCADS